MNFCINMNKHLVFYTIKSLLQIRCFFLVLLSLFVGMFFLAGCTYQSRKAYGVRSAYYWSTSWINIPKSYTFTNHLNRLYVRYFDVVLNESRVPVPNATFSFNSSHEFVDKGNAKSDISRVSDSLEIVPVIFIVNEVMRKPQPQLAQQILDRVLQMNATNDIHRVHELQIDCDWTNSTRQHFFSMLQQLHTLASKHHITLSATIRLHQLMQSAPPVDRGVLMVYNTGDFTRRSCEHPILDMRDINPYLDYLSDYSLPLTAAYPLFAYRIAFRGNHYLGILHADDDLPLLPGDTVITRKSTAEEVLQVQKKLMAIRPDINDEVIVFDLSKNHLSYYKSKDYEKVYHLH